MHVIMDRARMVMDLISAIKDQCSTESSLASLHKEAISNLEMEEEENPSMEKTLMTKILNYTLISHSYSQWPIPDLIPTDLNSL